METLSFFAMGCHMSGFVAAAEADAWEGLQRVPLWFEEWEQILSRFRPESELSRINRHPNQEHVVSPVFAQVLTLALQMEKESDGWVTPAVLNALEAAGYDRSFESLPETSFHHSSMPAGRISSDALRWQAETRQLVLPQGLRLDFGGVAKGWAAHQAAQRLAAVGPAMVNAGGDLSISDPLPDGSAWRIAVENPLVPGENLAVLPVLRGGVASSGSDYRRWMQDGHWQHHLIDPHSGRPSQSDLLQVTILAPNVMQAEMAAKTVFLLGSRAGAQWLDQHESFLGVWITNSGEVSFSPSLQIEFLQEELV